MTVSVTKKWLAAKSLLTGEMKQVLEVLQQGLSSSAQAEFVKQLSVNK